jgi:hypothetical protein
LRMNLKLKLRASPAVLSMCDFSPPSFSYFTCPFPTPHIKTKIWGTANKQVWETFLSFFLSFWEQPTETNQTIYPINGRCFSLGKWLSPAIVKKHHV